MADATTSQKPKQNKKKSKRKLEKDRLRSQPYFENRRARAAEATPEQPPGDFDLVDSNSGLMSDGEHGGDMPLPDTSGLETAANHSRGSHAPMVSVERSELTRPTGSQHAYQGDASVGGLGGPVTPPPDFSPLTPDLSGRRGFVFTAGPLPAQRALPESSARAVRVDQSGSSNLPNGRASQRPTISGASSQRPTISGANLSVTERNFLRGQGYDPDLVGNGMFAPCSESGHTLQWLIDVREHHLALLDSIQSVELGPDGRCLPLREVNFAGQTMIKHKCAVNGCDGSTASSMQWQRVFAASLLPESEQWKMVLNSKRGKSSRLVRAYECSARCNHFGGTHHCVRKDHINIETSAHNERRKLHHAGYTQCDCDSPCIGENVKFEPTGKQVAASRSAR
ncbi:hypothetical protein LTR49_013462 [Elasticomyces elasticus]|nr:hypothetical protein LTR49_013462 [Elasticomyces elasticus]